MVFQIRASSLHPMLTIERQLTEHLLSTCAWTRQARRRALALLEESACPIRRQRCAVIRISQRRHAPAHPDAMALACEPSLLIADEPTTALDVTVQAGILRLIDRAPTHHWPCGHPDHPRSGRAVRRCRLGDRMYAVALSSASDRAGRPARAPSVYAWPARIVASSRRGRPTLSANFGVHRRAPPSDRSAVPSIRAARTPSTRVGASAAVVGARARNEPWPVRSIRLRRFRSSWLERHRAGRRPG